MDVAVADGRQRRATGCALLALLILAAARAPRDACVAVAKARRAGRRGRRLAAALRACREETRPSGPFTRGDLRIRCDCRLMTSDARCGGATLHVMVNVLLRTCVDVAVVRRLAGTLRQSGQGSGQGLGRDQG